MSFHASPFVSASAAQFHTIQRAHARFHAASSAYTSSCETLCFSTRFRIFQGLLNGPASFCRPLHFPARFHEFPTAPETFRTLSGVSTSYLRVHRATASSREIPRASSHFHAPPVFSTRLNAFPQVSTGFRAPPHFPQRRLISTRLHTLIHMFQRPSAHFLPFPHPPRI